jgi:hypothetical protein
MKLAGKSEMKASGYELDKRNRSEEESYEYHVCCELSIECWYRGTGRGCYASISGVRLTSNVIFVDETV